MSDDERQPNPRGPAPGSNDPRLRELGADAQTSLIEQLGAVADDLRQIPVDLGARPYTCHFVRLRWTGGDVGRGEAQVALDVEMKPTPRRMEGGSITRELTGGGITERGDITLVGVSPRYTEDELDSYLGEQDGEEAFVEVRIDQRDGTTRRDRYVLAKAPERRPTKFDWRLVLRRQDGARERNGSRPTPGELVW